MPSGSQPTSARAASRSSGANRVEIDAAVDHGRLAGSAGRCSLEAQPQPVGDRDDGRRTPHREPGRAAHHPRALRVGDVLAVGGEDGGRPSRDRAEQPRRNEEVRVDDVRSEASSGPARRRGRGSRCRPWPAAAVDDRPRELVPARLEPRLEVGHEGPQRRRGSAPGTSGRRAGCARARRSAAGDLQDPEAHLVGRPLAPQDVARLLPSGAPGRGGT